MVCPDSYNNRAFVLSRVELVARQMTVSVNKSRVMNQMVCFEAHVLQDLGCSSSTLNGFYQPKMLYPIFKTAHHVDFLSAFDQDLLGYGDHLPATQHRG